MRLTERTVTPLGVLLTLAMTLALAGCGGSGGGGGGGLPAPPTPAPAPTPSPAPTGGGGTSGGGGSTSTGGGNVGGGGGSTTGGGGGTAVAATGEVSITLTDAPSDQLERFEVDVTSIDLTRPSGVPVAVLPAKRRVDFARLVTVSDLITAGSVPEGLYDGVAITLDLSSANVVISGSATPAKLVDQDGAALTGRVTRTIRFDPLKTLLIAPGLNKLVAIDFDLDASCSIDAAANEVTLGPVLTAEAEPVAPPKLALIGGAIASVDTATTSFQVELKLAGMTGTFPKVKVETDAATLFRVNGEAATFAELAAMPQGSPVFAQGKLGSKAFLAKAVESWTPLDTVEGHVLSRSVDGVLAIKTSVIQLADGSILFNEVVTTDARGAKVFKRGALDAIGLDAIGVGQRVIARGKLNGTDLDATAGQLALVETGIFGYAKGPAAGGLLTIKLERFDGRPVGGFDWNVGGTQTADPASYTIDVGTLDVASITSNTPVAIRGFVSPWNSTPAAVEARADSVTDRSLAWTPLYVTWPFGRPSPFRAIDASGLTLDLRGSWTRVVDQGFVAPIRFATTDKPRVVPAAGAGLLPKFVIVQGTRVALHPTFAAWQADVLTRLAAGAEAKGFAALGKWDGSTQTLTASSAAISLK